MYTDQGIIHVAEPVGDIPEDDFTEGFQLSGAQAKQRFREFFRNFRLGNTYIYRDALVKRFNREEYFIEVDLAHVAEYDEVLFNNIHSMPTEFMPSFEAGAKDALKYILTAKSAETVAKKVPDFHVILRSTQYPQSLRSLTSEHVNKLVKVPGIIISCTRVRAKATLVVAQCSACNTKAERPCKTPKGGVSLPRSCSSQGTDGKACKGEYVILTDQCEYIDQQTLKLQECPEVVPTGEMPRNIMLSVDRYLVDRVTPGTRISVIAVLSLFNDMNKTSTGNTAIRTPYLRVVGIQADGEGDTRMTSMFTAQEEEQMLRLARDPDIYMKIAKSIAPQISGDYTIDIKKALACLLMGGSRKRLDDGVRLRGDINVLLMGDPSTAKSQFLKFIQKVAPIGVYTSGKGSSAAGLTAMVSKDNKSGEFYLEGGAMVLADGGIICIDEFDKMRETDRVAIHEAMEQQTISIAKAGITTMLNSRTSVLAAANPIGGRYDDLKSVGENIDLMTTILSRFDCIFIVKDVRDEERDKSIARHVLGVHIDSYNSDAQNTEIDVATLKKFVMYCRERCAPRLNQEAAALLSSHYVQIRNQVRNSLNATGESVVVPISIRQLEALVRLSESLAKMRLSAEATVNDVNEALRLFRVSTLAASQANPLLANLGPPSEEVRRAEDFLKRRLSVRMTVASKSLVEEGLVNGLSNDAIRRAIGIMVQRNELQELNQQKILKRLR